MLKPSVLPLSALLCLQVSVSQSKEEENQKGVAQLCPSYEGEPGAPAGREAESARASSSFIYPFRQSVSQSIILTDILTYAPLLSWESVSKQKGPNLPPSGACTLQGETGRRHNE